MHSHNLCVIEIVQLNTGMPLIDFHFDTASFWKLTAHRSQFFKIICNVVSNPPFVM
jgi:hypothetical protein